MQQTNVLEYLEHTVKRLPDKVAYSNESEGLTFAEVYHDSRAIGSYLNSKGYYGEPVVVFMKKHPKVFLPRTAELSIRICNMQSLARCSQSLERIRFP